MAKVNFRNNKHGLGGSKDTDLEGINDSNYDVYSDDVKLANAQRDFPNYNWFASFTIKDKSGKEASSVPEYTITFDKPESGTLYYYLNGAATPLTYNNANDKNNKKRVKATLTLGDPPIGMG